MGGLQTLFTLNVEFNFNDGGRTRAGYKGRTGDCVTRAVAIAAQLPYQQVYNGACRGNATQRVTKRMDKARRNVKTASQVLVPNASGLKDYMAGLGFKFVATMGIGTGCQITP